jgi:ubiquinone/menaquinone biosynthesis C-methylase UbiE
VGRRNEVIMGVPFDHIASSYDSSFTRTPIGQLQRRQVWSYLEKTMLELKGLDILELNCGTGEDAVLFSEKGFNIVATDVSEEMLKVTQEKVQQYSMQNKISSQYLDLDSFDDSLFEKKFDLVFSNFGGLNCINPESLQKLLSKLPSILSPEGRFVAVIMPKLCLWESLYFLFKLQFKNAFRRYTTGSVEAALQGAMVKTWYFRPTQVKAWASKFNVVHVKPIGISLPPSYLHNFFTRHKYFLSFLNSLEKKLNRLSILAGAADHYLIDLQVKPGRDIS